MDVHSSNVEIHVAAGALALAVGLAPLLAVKGSWTHRLSGRAFVAAGTIVAATALVGIVWFSAPGPLVAAFVAFVYQFVSGLRALAMRRRGPDALDALIAFLGLGVCILLLAFMGRGDVSWTPAIGYSTVSYVALLGIYDLSRYGWPSAWRNGIWRFDHGLKMTGAYFAMASAAAGNILRNAQPWSQVVPSAIGALVMIALVVIERRRRAQLDKETRT